MKSQIFFLIIFSASPEICPAQFHVTYIGASLENCIGKNTSTNYQRGGQFSTVDTGDYDIGFNQIINQNFDGKNLTYYNFQNATQFFLDGYAHKITLTLDSDLKIIRELTVDYRDTTYRFSTTDDNYNSNDKILSCKNIPFAVSKNKDTISALIKGTDINPALVSSNMESWNRTGYLDAIINTSFPIQYTDNSTLSIMITGDGPLLNVLNRSEETSVKFNSLSKTLTLFKSFNKLAFCYDLLGRKHPLEFLGSDGTSNTYSLRSLSPGVYFVNDGRETVKFLIGE